MENKTEPEKKEENMSLAQAAELLKVVIPPSIQPRLGDCKTVGEFLFKCSSQFIKEDAEFSGKCPLGSSGWIVSLALALGYAKKIPGVHVKDIKVFYGGEENIDFTFTPAEGETRVDRVGIYIKTRKMLSEAMILAGEYLSTVYFMPGRYVSATAVFEDGEVLKMA